MSGTENGGRSTAPTLESCHRSDVSTGGWLATAKGAPDAPPKRPCDQGVQRYTKRPVFQQVCLAHVVAVLPATSPHVIEQAMAGLQ